MKLFYFNHNNLFNQNFLFAILFFSLLFPFISRLRKKTKRKYLIENDRGIQWEQEHTNKRQK